MHPATHQPRGLPALEPRSRPRLRRRGSGACSSCRSSGRSPCGSTSPRRCAESAPTRLSPPELRAGHSRVVEMVGGGPPVQRCPTVRRHRSPPHRHFGRGRRGIDVEGKRVQDTGAVRAPCRRTPSPPLAFGRVNSSAAAHRTGLVGHSARELQRPWRRELHVERLQTRIPARAVIAGADADPEGVTLGVGQRPVTVWLDVAAPLSGIGVQAPEPAPRTFIRRTSQWLSPASLTWWAVGGQLNST